MRPTGLKGSVLITSLLAAAILLGITVPYVSRVATEYKLMMKIYNSTAALDLAEAGVERALWEIRYNNSLFSGWTSVVDGSGKRTCAISVDSFQTDSGETIGDYTVSAVIAADGMSAAVTCTGYVPNRTSPDENRTVKVAYARNNFGKAVIGLNGVTMSGNAATDSYDSDLGTYASQPHTQQGDIASNGRITLSGNAYVNGDANPGASYPFVGVPPVSGSYGTLQAPITVDPIPPSAISAARASNNNANMIYSGDNPLNGYDFSISGSDTVTLPAGTYYFTSISISGQAQITISGSVTIFVDGGNVSVTGIGMVNNGLPRNLLLYSTGSSVNMSGISSYYGAIYAPSATVTLSGNENFYGSIICGTNFDTGNAKIHYDLDLMGVTPVFANHRVTSWQETN